MRNIWRSLILLYMVTAFGVVNLTAQTDLERISITERSDGNGLVIRYHLSEMVDSFRVVQPDLNRIQILLISDEIDTSGIEMPDLNGEIAGFSLHMTSEGIGNEISTAENVFFRTEAYSDQNMRDLLLNLEYASRQEVEDQLAPAEAYDWQKPEDDQNGSSLIETTDSNQQTGDAKPVRMQEPPSDQNRGAWTLHFGVSGGLGLAFVTGADYRSSHRLEPVMGITAYIGLPFDLPFRIRPVVQSGVFLAEKGFTNPKAGIEAETVALDYIDVPVMVQFQYEWYPIIQPYLGLGLYSSFKASAEAINRHGDRTDLDQNIRSVNSGWVIGAGNRIDVGDVGIDLQLRMSGSFSPVFKDGFSGSEKNRYIAALVSFWF